MYFKSRLFLAVMISPCSKVLPFSSKIESLYAGMILPSSIEIDRKVLEKMPKRFSVMNRQRVFRNFQLRKAKVIAYA